MEDPQEHVFCSLAATLAGALGTLVVVGPPTDAQLSEIIRRWKALASQLGPRGHGYDAACAGNGRPRARTTRGRCHFYALSNPMLYLVLGLGACALLALVAEGLLDRLVERRAGRLIRDGVAYRAPARRN